MSNPNRDPQTPLVDRAASLFGSARCCRRSCLAAVGFALAVRVLHAEEDDASLYLADDVDRAVESGVDFLVKSQRADGAIADRSNHVAMTSLSIMAMAAIGTQPSTDSARGRAMLSAIDFVLDPNHQDTRGYLGHRDGSRMYGHGITTLMLTEMLGMGATTEQNQRMHETLVEAIKLILASQAVEKSETHNGGWRYTPNSSDSDLSVSVWQVMALRSAKNDGLDVPGEAIEQAIQYLRNSYTSPLDRNGVPRDTIGGFSYTPNTQHPTFTMTAAGMLAMQVCGQYESPLVAGAAEWLLQHPPRRNERFFHYGIYYYAQSMHQAGGKYAERANKLVPELLLDRQHSNGAWQARDGEERNIGKVYATSLSILSLSVRYHYLPIYQR